MAEGNAEVKESPKQMGIVGELLRPFGSQAYKEMREKGEGRLKSVILGLCQAIMPATYGIIRKDAEAAKVEAGKLEAGKSKGEGNKGKFSSFLGFVSAFSMDAINNLFTVTLPGYPLSRWIYGQVGTRVYEK